MRGVRKEAPQIIDETLDDTDIFKMLSKVLAAMLYGALSPRSKGFRQLHPASSAVLAWNESSC